MGQSGRIVGAGFFLVLQENIFLVILQYLRADTLNLYQVVDRFEGAVLLRVGDDGPRPGRADTPQFAGDRVGIGRRGT